jgi:hypothetical protein
MQLVRNRHHPLLFESFTKVNKKVDPVILPLWSEFIGLTHNPDLAYRYYEQVRDMFYSRITLEDMNYNFLAALLGEARAIVDEMLKDVKTELN